MPTPVGLRPLLIAKNYTINGVQLPALNLSATSADGDQVGPVTIPNADGGQEGQCGWLKDKFGLSWQIVPTILPELMSDTLKAGRVTQAFLQMKKFDIEKLLQA